MDLSTVGIKFGWGVEATAGTKPTSFTWIPRCSKIGGISLTKEKIESTCLEDEVKQYIAGISDTGGEIPLNFNGSKKFVERWNELLDAYETGKEAGKATWADIYIPGFGSYFIKFEPGEIPMPDLESNNKLDMQISNVIGEWIGLGDSIEPKLATGDTE